MSFELKVAGSKIQGNRKKIFPKNKALDAMPVEAKFELDLKIDGKSKAFGMILKDFKANFPGEVEKNISQIDGYILKARATVEQDFQAALKRRDGSAKAVLGAAMDTDRDLAKYWKEFEKSVGKKAEGALMKALARLEGKLDQELNKGKIKAILSGGGIPSLAMAAGAVASLAATGPVGVAVGGLKMLSGFISGKSDVGKALESYKTDLESLAGDTANVKTAAKATGQKILRMQKLRALLNTRIATAEQEIAQLKKSGGQGAAAKEIAAAEKRIAALSANLVDTTAHTKALGKLMLAVGALEKSIGQDMKRSSDNLNKVKGISDALRNAGSIFDKVA